MKDERDQRDLKDLKTMIPEYIWFSGAAERLGGERWLVLLAVLSRGADWMGGDSEIKEVREVSVAELEVMTGVERARVREIIDRFVDECVMLAYIPESEEETMLISVRSIKGFIEDLGALRTTYQGFLRYIDTAEPDPDTLGLVMDRFLELRGCAGFKDPAADIMRIQEMVSVFPKDVLLEALSEAKKKGIRHVGGVYFLAIEVERRWKKTKKK